MYVVTGSEMREVGDRSNLVFALDGATQGLIGTVTENGDRAGICRKLANSPEVAEIMCRSAKAEEKVSELLGIVRGRGINDPLKQMYIVQETVACYDNTVRSVPEELKRQDKVRLPSEELASALGAPIVQVRLGGVTTADGNPAYEYFPLIQ